MSAILREMKGMEGVNKQNEEEDSKSFLGRMDGLHLFFQKQNVLFVLGEIDEKVREIRLKVREDSFKKSERSGILLKCLFGSDEGNGRVWKEKEDEQRRLG